MLRRRLAAVGDAERQGRVIFAYVPGHEGCVPNAVADAVAKAHLGAPPARGAVNAAAMASTTRILQDAVAANGRLEVEDRGTYTEVGEAVQAWVVRKLHSTTTRGILCGLELGDVWVEVMAALAGDMSEPGDGREGPDARVTAQNARCGAMYGMRVGEHMAVAHGAQWEKRRAAEGTRGGRATRSQARGCAGCSAHGQLETMRHVILCECGQNGDTLVRMHRALCELRTAVAQVDSQNGKLHGIVQAAVGLVARAQRGRTRDERAWRALQRVIAGVIPRGDKVTVGGIRARTAARMVAVKVAAVQHVAAQRLDEWQRRTAQEKQRRTAEDDEWATHGDGAAAAAAHKAERKRARQAADEERAHDAALAKLVEREERLTQQAAAAQTTRAGCISARTRQMRTWQAEGRIAQRERVWATESDGTGLRAGGGAIVVGMRNDARTASIQNMQDVSNMNGTKVTLQAFNDFAQGWEVITADGRTLFFRACKLLGDDDEWEGLTEWRKRQHDGGDIGNECDGDGEGSYASDVTSEGDSDSGDDEVQDNVVAKTRRLCQRHTMTKVRWVQNAWQMAMADKDDG